MIKKYYFPACFTILFLLLLFDKNITGQNTDHIPGIHSNLHFDQKKDIYYFEFKQMLFREKKFNASETLDKYRVIPMGNDTGIIFDFKDKSLSGKLYYGFIGSKLQKYREPVYYKDPAKIVQGIAVIDINHNLGGEYDFVDWQTTGSFSLGYRIVNNAGTIIYDGKTEVLGKGPFSQDISLVEGPFLNNVTESSAVISFSTDRKITGKIMINNRSFTGKSETKTTEIHIDGLKPDSEYNYTIYYGNKHESYTLKTNPQLGSRKHFSFCFASDSRYGAGGGERNIYGTNAYIVKKIAAFAVYKKASFLIFSGDMIDGYNFNRSETELQFSNWKRAVEPFANSLPIYTGMGNHEIISTQFKDSTGKKIEIDKFPYDKESAESVFRDNFVNPENGPYSEDSSAYDPDAKSIDFPSYKESVYSFTYDNAGFVMLNGDYWYSNTTSTIPFTGGNPHGYIMDNQLKWLKQIIYKMENDNTIDHIFISIHTPPFPNGGHSADDMWYKGNNEIRPYIGGQPVKKGIIERRDEFLNIIINENKKVVALLCGDEHNYSRMIIRKNGNYYPDNFTYKPIQISRNIWQITNGAAGAPYYAKEKMPWSDCVEFFTTQYALVFIHISGKDVKLEAVNPDTLEKIEEIQLR